MKVMAIAMLDVMIKEEGGKINYRVLAYVLNLVPYSDNRILKARTEDIKLFISTVVRTVRLKSKERELVRPAPALFKFLSPFLTNAELVKPVYNVTLVCGDT